jgi:hypothetical protein
MFSESMFLGLLREIGYRTEGRRGIRTLEEGWYCEDSGGGWTILSILGVNVSFLTTCPSILYRL